MKNAEMAVEWLFVRGRTQNDDPLAWEIVTHLEGGTVLSLQKQMTSEVIEFVHRSRHGAGSVSQPPCRFCFCLNQPENQKE